MPARSQNLDAAWFAQCKVSSIKNGPTSSVFEKWRNMYHTSRIDCEDTFAVGCSWSSTFLAVFTVGVGVSCTSWRSDSVGSSVLLGMDGRVCFAAATTILRRVRASGLAPSPRSRTACWTTAWRRLSPCPRRKPTQARTAKTHRRLSVTLCFISMLFVRCSPTLQASWSAALCLLLVA